MPSGMGLPEAALWYVKNRIPVLPLAPCQKNPLTDNGVLDATTDERVVSQWWKRWPAANIGAPMGEASGLVGMDVDPANGAPQTRDDFIEEYGLLPETAEATSGRPNHRHVYFQHDPAIRVPHQLGPGVQFRLEGQYMVMPPSIHPLRKPYQFDGLRGREAILHPAAMPLWMIERFGRMRSTDTASLEHWRSVVSLAQVEPHLVNLNEEAQLERAMRDNKFRLLWNKELEGFDYPSMSEADEALVTKIVFWFGHDVDRTLRLLQRSKLWDQKWEREDYQIRTLGVGFEKQKRVWGMPQEPQELPYEAASNGTGQSTGGGAGAAPAKEKPQEKPKVKTFTWRDVPSVWSLEAHVSWVVDELVPEDAITMVTGDSGHGKTMLITAMCGAIAHGTEFLGRPVKQKPVLYLDRENPLAIVKQHLFDLGIKPHLDFRVWGMWCEQPPDSPTAVSLIEYVKEYKPVLVFDSLIAFHTGDEQSASETRRYLNHFRMLAAYGATIILIHHTGKGEGARDYRGSSDIKAGVDIAWHVQKTGDDVGKIDELKIRLFKIRLTGFPPFLVKLVDGEFVRNERAETQAETVERLVRTYPGQSKRELLKMAHDSGVSKYRAEQILDECRNKGLFIVHSAGGKDSYHAREVGDDD